MGRVVTPNPPGGYASDRTFKCVTQLAKEQPPEVELRAFGISRGASFVVDFDLYVRNDIRIISYLWYQLRAS